MDFVSHGLIGAALAAGVAKTPDEAAGIILFSVLPDIPQIPLYLYIGKINHRFLWIPKNSDWFGIRHKHPKWFILQDFPNSIWCIGFLILPLVAILGLPWILLYAYVFHVLLDFFTHLDKSVVTVPFYPFSKFSIRGFTDAWAWKFRYWMVSWALLSAVILLIVKLKN